MGTELAFYECLKLLAPKVTDELVVTSVGGVGREWYNLRPSDGNLYQTYMAGCTAIALGVAIALPHRKVISLDTDGSMLMGSTILPAIAKYSPANLIVIVSDNECYDATDKIPTFTASVADLEGIARESGLKKARSVRTLADFQEALDDAYEATEPSFIVVKAKADYAPVPFYVLDSIENKYRFVRYIEKTENKQIFRPPLLKVPGPK